jgi:hypothetical protein
MLVAYVSSPGSPPITVLRHDFGGRLPSCRMKPPINTFRPVILANMVVPLGLVRLAVPIV